MYNLSKIRKMKLILLTYVTIFKCYIKVVEEKSSENDLNMSIILVFGGVGFACYGLSVH
jgi:hypothetical protein